MLKPPRCFLARNTGWEIPWGLFAWGDYRYGENIQQAALRSFTGKDRAAR